MRNYSVVVYDTDASGSFSSDYSEWYDFEIRDHALDCIRHLFDSATQWRSRLVRLIDGNTLDCILKVTICGR